MKTAFVSHNFEFLEHTYVRWANFEMAIARQSCLSREIFQHPARLAPPCGCKMRLGKAVYPEQDEQLR